MRRWLIGSAFLALVLTLMGQGEVPIKGSGLSGYPAPQVPAAVAQDSYSEPGVTGAVTANGYLVRDFAPEKPGEPTLYNDSVARVVVRFDDGRAAQFTTNQIQAFLRRGIPVTVSLNADNIGTAGFMTWSQIRTLQEFARGHGTTLHIGQHTNGNFATPFLLTHDEVVAELETSEIFQETGYRPRVLVIPGDAGRREFFKRNWDYMVSVADSLGLWWIDCNEGLSNSAGDTLSYASFVPSVMDLDNYAAQRSNFKSTNLSWQRPGMGIKRWELISTTIDLGNLVVERVASDLGGNFALTTSLDLGDRSDRYGYEFETGVKPPLHSGWTLTGNGANATAAGVYRRTWANYYTSALATNRGFAVVLHDSARSDGATPPTGISNAEYVAGAVSPDHIAWTLAMLEKNGHIKCVGYEEYAEWVTGDYAIGTDLINNPRCLIPQYDIGDTLGATSEYAWARGLGTNNLNFTTHTNSASQFGFLQVEQTGNVAKFARRTAASSADNPYWCVGDSVTGTRGRSGGVLFYADGSSAPSRYRAAFGDLKPGGIYRFSADFNVPAGTDMLIEEMHFAWMGKYSKPVASVTTGFAAATRDTVISWQWRDQNDTAALPAFSDAKWGTWQIPLYFPYLPTGETLAGANYGSTSEAVGARLFKPYADGAGAASEGILIDGKWAWTLQIIPGVLTRMSNPRLVYLGQQ